jgi:hypothetical protein
MFKKSIWRNFILGRVHRLKIETIAIRVPNVPYLSATLSDWYMAIAIVGGNAPLNMVLRIGVVSPSPANIPRLLYTFGG